MTQHSRGVLMAAGTALLFGITSSVAKLISADGLSQMSVMAYRTIFVVLTLGLWFRFSKGAEFFRLPRGMLLYYVVLGFLTVVCMAGGFMMSCVYLSVPHAIILHYIFPLFTIAGAYLLNRERPTRMEILAAILVIVGLYMGFAGKDAMDGPISVVGLLWGIASVLGFAAQALLTRRMVRAGKTNPMTQLFYTNLFGGAMIIVMKSLVFGWGDLSGLSWPVFALMQYPTIAGSIVAFGLLFTALKICFRDNGEPHLHAGDSGGPGRHAAYPRHVAVFHGGHGIDRDPARGGLLDPGEEGRVSFPGREPVSPGRPCRRHSLSRAPHPGLRIAPCMPCR